MFSKLIAWIKGEVQTVEGIVAHFHATIKNLETHAALQVEEAKKLEDKVVVLKQKAQNAVVEADKAVTIAKQIGAIVNTDVSTVKAQAKEVETTIQA